MKFHHADLVHSSRIDSVLARNKLNKEGHYAFAHPTERTFKLSGNQYPKYI
ncbi:MAG: hypothetical protein ACFCU7_04015 [Pleurocapsa sp.]